MSWFSDLTGIHDDTPRAVRTHLTVEGRTLMSRHNGRRYEIGHLTTPTLAELRHADSGPNGTLFVDENVGDVQPLHLQPENAGAAFQVASQFNLLEMVGPAVTPDDGVARYQNDPTQGPACAIACGAGTIYRNYFHPVQGGIGQSANRQIDCLADIGDALGNDTAGYWVMRNGYALPTSHGLAALDHRLAGMSEGEIDALRAALRVGIQADTEVTLGNAGHLVTQVFCSALPVAYGAGDARDWERFARLVLEAAYEATLLAGAANARRTGNKRVFLTMLGGGAFGNDRAWIVDAMVRALRLARGHDLEVSIVSYGRPDPAVAEVLSKVQAALPD